MLLAGGDGVAVGLRCVFAHRTGLHLPIVLIARAVHADAAAGRLRGHGNELRVELGPSDGSAAIRLTAFATEGAGGEDEYREESSYWYAGLPSTPAVTLTVAWPAIGLRPATTALQLPDLPRVARAAVALR